MDEVFKIERLGEGSFVVDNFMRSEFGFVLSWFSRRASGVGGFFVFFLYGRFCSS